MDLFSLAKDGNENDLENLLKTGIDSNKRDKHNRTAIHIAAFHGHVNIIQLLCKYGADLNLPAQNSSRAIHFAAMNGHLNVITYLIGSGQRINIADGKSNTPAHIAAQRGQRFLLSHLIAMGANMQAKNKSNETPLSSLKISIGEVAGDVKLGIITEAEKINIESIEKKPNETMKSPSNPTFELKGDTQIERKTKRPICTQDNDTSDSETYSIDNKSKKQKTEESIKNNDENGIILAAPSGPSIPEHILMSMKAAAGSQS